MKAEHFLLLVATCIAFRGSDTKAQQIVSAKAANPALPLDPFFDDDEFEKSYPQVVSLKYHIKENKLRELITEVALNNVVCPYKGCNITLIDIAEATQISRHSTDNIAEAMAKVNITPSDQFNMLLLYHITPDLIEGFLQKFGLTFSDIYNNFVKSLSNPGQSIPAILNRLNVSVIDFMNAQAYGNDTTRLNVLATGNYSEENLKAVLSIANKTKLDMLKLIPLNTIAGQLRKVDPNQLTVFAKNLGLTGANLEPFYQHLNITPINFLSYPPFIQVITGFYDILNPEEVLGTIVSQSKVVTVNKAKVLLPYQDPNTVLLRNYANFHIELLENPLVQYVVKNITPVAPGYQSEDIALIGIISPVVTTSADIFNAYNNSALLNCTYVSKSPLGDLYSENVSVQFMSNNHVVSVAKTGNVAYNLGSPLFCQDKLFGIATEDNPKEIKFATFMKKRFTIATTLPSGQTPGIGGGETYPGSVTTAKPASKAASIVVSALNIVIALVVLKFSMHLVYY